MTINDIKIITLTCVNEENGRIVIAEEVKDLPFKISRIFSVVAPLGSIRGQHAHKNCKQFLTCPLGEVEVFCDDGQSTNIYILDKPQIGILIPPGIWASQTYNKENTILNVICDLPYDEKDYIRSYEEYKSYVE